MRERIDVEANHITFDTAPEMAERNRPYRCSILFSLPALLTLAKVSRNLSRFAGCLWSRTRQTANSMHCLWTTRC